MICLTNNDTRHHYWMRTDGSFQCCLQTAQNNVGICVWIHVSYPGSSSKLLWVVLPSVALSQIQMVLLSWWHLSGWSLGWAELGTGQSDSVSLATLTVSNTRFCWALSKEVFIIATAYHWSTLEKRRKCSSIKQSHPEKPLKFERNY